MQFKIKENKEVESWKLRELSGEVKGPEHERPGAQRPLGQVSRPLLLRLALWADLLSFRSRAQPGVCVRKKRSW